MSDDRREMTAEEILISNLIGDVAYDSSLAYGVKLKIIGMYRRALAHGEEELAHHIEGRIRITGERDRLREGIDTLKEELRKLEEAKKVSPDIMRLVVDL
jgi:hypothetical protein